MKIIDSHASLKDRSYYFHGRMDDSISIHAWRLRSEDAVGRDTDSVATATSIVYAILGCIPACRYFMFSSDIEERSAFRIKRGAAWRYPELGKLTGASILENCGGNQVSYATVFDLSTGDGHVASCALLDRHYGLVVLTHESLNSVVSAAKEWILTTNRSESPYDQDAIGASLAENPAMAILRYFPADNGKDESIAIVCRESFIDDATRARIDSIAANCRNEDN